MRSILLLFIVAITFEANAQDVGYLLNEGAQLEKEMKDADALKKYQEALQLAPTDIKALSKCSELNSIIGNRVADKKSKQEYFNAAKTFAETALKVDGNNADANYAMALALARYSAASGVKERMDAVKEIKQFLDRSLSSDSLHFKSLHLLGRWNYEVTEYNVAEKAALKVAFGGLPSTSYAKAIELMEKSRRKSPNYLVNYLDLAKAYKSNGQSDKAIEILNRLIKLPPKTADDEGYKAEGKKMLESLL
jgi:tetratricopeptide (TPR) repeat protein